MALGTYWSLQISLPDMPRLSHPGDNQHKTLPESSLIISSAIMASLPSFTMTKVAALKAKLLRSCVPLQTLISRGPLLITPWAIECLKDLIKRSLICLELLRMTKSVTGTPTCLFCSMHTIQHAMQVLGTRLIF